MKKFGKIFGMLLLVLVLCAALMLTGCWESDEVPKEENNDTVTPEEKDEYVISLSTVYNMAKEAGYTGTLEDLIAAFKGDAGEDGKDGKDGAVIESVKYENSRLILILTNGKTIDCGIISLEYKSEIAIGENGNWIINGEDTGVSAKGQKGEDAVIADVTLTFDTAGGSAVEPITAQKGVSVDLPLTVKDGYIFGGWYCDNQEKPFWFTDITPLTEDMTLVAYWFTCDIHLDENRDKKCDICNSFHIDYCDEHIDDNADGICDYCGVLANEAVLIKDGLAHFQFVIANGSSGAIAFAVKELKNDLGELGLDVDTVWDESGTIRDCEVLIGSVSSRGLKYSEMNGHDYGWDGYAIKLIDGKVVIIGGSEESLVEAIKIFKKEILGITDKTESLEYVKMTEEDSIEVIQDNYYIKSVLLAGTDIRDYVIAADKAEFYEYNAALVMQEHLYQKTGVWLDIVGSEDIYANGIIINLSTPETCASEKGFIVKFEGNNLILDCGFENKIEDAVMAFIMTSVTGKNVPKVSLEADYIFEKIDFKNIYYEDFGARGDGYTNDFYAIKAAHDYANHYGHTVNAAEGATYFLGERSVFDTLVIETDTNWNGCVFIFDDGSVVYPE